MMTLDQAYSHKHGKMETTNPAPEQPCVLCQTSNQSVLPAGPVLPRIPPNGPPFSSSQMAPPPDLLLAFLPNTTATPHAAIKPMDDNQGCLDHVVLILQKMWKNEEFEDFGVREGGFLRVFGKVSRMEVRDGTIGFPVEVWSQYRRF